MNTAKYVLRTEGDLKLISFDQFKKLHGSEYDLKKLTFNGLVCKISSVEITDDGIRILFEEDFPQMEIFIAFDGSGYRVSRSGFKNSFNCMRGEGHKRIQIQRRPINIERLIAISYDIAMNTLANSYDGLVANVMDGSGNMNTASDLGVNPDYHFNNLEWCTSDENKIHGGWIKKLHALTGHVYRFSYENCRTLLFKKQEGTLKTWCAGNLHQVK